MKGIKEIKNRIRAVDSASKITSAMQLVAASKMKKAQNSAINSRPYLQYLSEILHKLSYKQFERIRHPFFNRDSPEKRCIVVVSTDKGLCGVLNNNLFRYLSDLVKDKNIQWIAVGKRAAQFLCGSGCRLAANFTVSDKVEYHELSGLCRILSQRYLNGDVDHVDVAYSQFVNTLSYKPTIQPILPMDDFQKLFNQMAEKDGVDVTNNWVPAEAEIIFEPSVDVIVDEIARIFLKYNLHQVLLEAKASEHSARMVAMKNATDNAKSLSQELKLEYNKARQYSITSEIIELSVAASSNN